MNIGLLCLTIALLVGGFVSIGAGGKKLLKGTNKNQAWGLIILGTIAWILAFVLSNYAAWQIAANFEAILAAGVVPFIRSSLNSGPDKKKSPLSWILLLIVAISIALSVGGRVWNRQDDKSTLVVEASVIIESRKYGILNITGVDSADGGCDYKVNEGIGGPTLATEHSSSTCSEPEAKRFWKRSREVVRDKMQEKYGGNAPDYTDPQLRLMDDAFSEP